jgi:acyl-CoA synthetase (AMP-forming)/AMP-acid ligase II
MIPGAHDPGRTAVVMAASGATLTYGELDAAANRIARMLRSMGLQPGDHLALCMENSPSYFEVVWGAHYAGLLYTACSTRLTAEELQYVVDDCGARVVVMSPRCAELAEAIGDATPRVERRLSAGGPIEGFEPIEDLTEGLDAAPLDEPRIAGRDMLYSSGTTGRPKGIRPRELTAPLDDAPVIVTPVLRDMLGVGPQDVYLSPAPLYHAAPLRFCLAFHQLGATVVVMERFDPAQALQVIAERRVTATQMVPTMFVRMLRLPEPERRAADVSSLRFALHAGAPCPLEIKRQMIDWWGPIIHEYYASTEGCGLTWITSEDWLAHPGSVGRALIGVAHIVGEDGRELGPGETGAVAFSDGPAFEYHNDPDKTAAATDERGWQSFGDIGHLDEDGFLYLTDRASHMIITGGVNVYPQETEDVLQSHPAVMDAAVFGVPSEEWGEEVKAVVQPVEMPGDEAGVIALTSELLAHCRAHLADLKCPRSIDLRAELPRHDTGKLYKRLLRDEYAQAAAGTT